MNNLIPISTTFPIGGNVGKDASAFQTQNAPFSDILQESMRNYREAQEISNQDAYDLALGRSDDLHTIAIHSAQATAALELTVQVASRAVSAYKEILQMQI